MNNKPARHVAVVGGGTAGWLAALVLQKELASQNKVSTRISVIESPDIPTVGVGEGSTSVFRQLLLDLGIDELEFLRETGATLKFGIKHAGWRKDRKDYFGPIDDPNQLVPTPSGAPTNWLHHARIRACKDVAGAHLFTSLMRARKSAFALGQDNRPIALSPYHHAYHFDQARMGRFLASKARDITHVLTEVQDIRRDADTGVITHLLCTDDHRIPVDLVIDCTGFRRAIIGRMGANWHSYSAMLPLNKAMPFWCEHDETRDIPPYTLAQAMNAGWMWGIPIRERMGCGYVFSDHHTTPEQAQSEVEAHLRCKIDPRGLISIDPGRLESAWIGNCIAMGLAQSFLEPLEATSIHGTIVQAMLLASFDPIRPRSDGGKKAATAYNKIVVRQVGDFAGFINIHYAGGRRDTDFWRDVAETGIADRQRNALAHWRNSPILPSDFVPFPNGQPHVEEQLYTPVLDGLGLLSPAASKSGLSEHANIALARKTLTRLRKEFRHASQSAMGHRAFLEFAATA
jgi:tryptophan halogenase